jgi:hypothetical protein
LDEPLVHGFGVLSELTSDGRLGPGPFLQVAGEASFKADACRAIDKDAEIHQTAAFALLEEPESIDKNPRFWPAGLGFPRPGGLSEVILGHGDLLAELQRFDRRNEKGPVDGSGMVEIDALALWQCEVCTVAVEVIQAQAAGPWSEMGGETVGQPGFPRATASDDGDKA